MSDHQTVELVKTSPVIGPLPVGSTYTWTYKAAARETAVQRAWRGLKRDHPDEGPTCWELVAPRVYQIAA